MKNLLCLGLAVLAAISFSSCTKKDQQYTGVDGDYVNGTPLSDRPAGSNFFGDNVIRGQFPPVYFAFDSTEISSDSQSKLQQVAEALKSGSKTLIVAGFTDDRGTEEYNRGLGERRADAVRQALINDGLNAARIQTVSFGQEMPADSGDNEAAWAKNRRAEFGIVK
jgi:peptidoglycan-associated lipoprotein